MWNFLGMLWHHLNDRNPAEPLLFANKIRDSFSSWRNHRYSQPCIAQISVNKWCFSGLRLRTRKTKLHVSEIWPFNASIPGGVFDHGVQFVSPIFVVGEAFEVDDQSLRKLPQVKLLGGLLVFLAPWTVPWRREMKFRRNYLSVLVANKKYYLLEH